MSPVRWLRRLSSLLPREGWALVLVLAGTSLLVVPPTLRGLEFLLWVAGVLLASTAIVLLGARAWPAFRE